MAPFGRACSGRRPGLPKWLEPSGNGDVVHGGRLRLYMHANTPSRPTCKHQPLHAVRKVFSPAGQSGKSHDFTLKRGLGLVLVRRPQLSHLDTPTPLYHHYHIASQSARTNFQSVHGQTLW